MKRNKIAMLLAMALTVTQSVVVPVAAEELTADVEQEVEMSQDDADAEAAVESEGAASEDAEVNIQEDEFSVGDGEDAEIQEEAEETQNVDFTAGDESIEAVGEEESKYSLMYDFMDGHTGNGTMLPNSQMTISTSVYHSDEDGDETISEAYKLELKPMEDDWDYTGKVDVSVDDNNIVINSHGVTGAFGIYVTVSSDAFKTFTSKVYFEISEYVIMPENATDADGNVLNPKVGEQIDIAKDMQPQLFRYEKDTKKLSPVTGDNYKIIIYRGTDEETGEPDNDYDTEGWEWIEVSGQELPILERITENGTSFALTALEKDEDGRWNYIARRDYQVDSLHDDGDNGDHGNNTPMLGPDVLTDANGNKLNPQVGEVIDYAKKGVALYHYVNGNLTGVGDPETLKIETVYDENDWSVQYTEGWDVPTMTRKTKDATWIFFKAWEKKLETGRWEIIDTKRYEFDATDKVHSHSWVTKNVVKEATCTEAGSKVENCASCDAVQTVSIPVKGHTVMKDAAVAPTVFADGKTEGSHCSVCGTVLEKQNTIAKVPGTIYLTASSLKMKTGQSTTAFKATGFSEGDYVTAVTSNKPRTVKVTNVNKNGTFKLTAGKKKGSAVVTVTLASKKTASFKVTVQKAAVKTTKITTTTKSLTLAKGATYKKLASSIAVTPVTSKEKVTYSSSNKKVATVSSKGVIKAKKAGTAKITVKSGSKKVVVTVKVTGVKTTNLSGVPAAKSVSKGKSFKIKAIATPKNTDEKITFKSSNKKVVTVTSKGVVKGLKKGTATITVQSGSKKMTCKVTVK